MEEWNKGNKMIRKIGARECPHDYLDISNARLTGMEQLASTHITWYTHKNPYGCWICDMFLLSRNVMDSFEEFLGPRGDEVDEGQTTLNIQEGGAKV